MKLFVVPTSDRFAFKALFVCCVLFLLIDANLGFGQYVKVVPPTPNAAKMTDFYAQQPGLYTGTATISIPLYNVDFEGWNLPLSISYNATGIRTNEEASEVGLGWSLNVTGVISRTVRGGDDLFEGTTNGMGVGFVHNSVPIQLDTQGAVDLQYDRFSERFPDPNSYYYYLTHSKPDTEPDIFNYNFFGYSGSFTLTQEAADPGGENGVFVKKLTEDATKISFNKSTKTFSIITPQGFRGDFLVKERSTSMSGIRATLNEALACGDDKFDHVFLINESGRLRTITSWYLTKITSPKGREIRFEYDLSENLNFGLGQTGESPYISNQRTFAEDGGAGQPLQCLQTIHEHIYLKAIVSEHIGLRLDFTMEDREDLRKNSTFTPGSLAIHIFPNGQDLKRFTGITITGLDPSSTLSKSITFKQNYFHQEYHKTSVNDENEVKWMRSRLDRVTIDDQEYSFKYYDGWNNLPSKLTKGIDHFGFYNGRDDNKFLLYPAAPYNDGNCSMSSDIEMTYTQQSDRLVNFDFGKAGLLEKVIYPTRGYSTFEYEPHTYIPDLTAPFHEAGIGGTAGGARIKAIKEFGYDDQPLRHRRYVYANGILMTPLMNLGKSPRYIFGDPAQGQPEVLDQCNFKIEPNTSIPGNNAAEGKIIGYSKVEEIVEGNGESYKNSYSFENRPNIKLDIPIATEGFTNLNGLTKEVRNYNTDGKVVQITLNEDYEHNLDLIHGIAYRYLGGDYLNLVQSYDVKRTFHTPFSITKTTASTPSEILEQGGSILSVGNSFVTSTTRTYGQKFLIRTEETTTSTGEILKKEYWRPGDYTAPHPTLNYMTNSQVNIIEPVIEEVTTRNGVVISASANRYDLQNGLINLTASYEYNYKKGSLSLSPNGHDFAPPYEQRVTYNLYDNQNGNLLEYTSPSGVVNSFVWGYNNLLPIVQGMGIGHTQLNSAYNTAAAGSDYETTLRSLVNAQGGQATTYQHDPLVGVTALVDPSGQKKTFVYDEFERLNKVLDHEGNTLEQYEFHLKERPATRILSLSGTLTFGTLTPDFFEPTFLEYEKCSDAYITRTLTIANSGEDDLHVTQIGLPTGFASSWEGGTIAPGTQVDAIISFYLQSPGDYSGTLTIQSDQTNSGGNSIPVSAAYLDRICDMDVSTTLVDFGNTTNNFAQATFNVINNGNAPVKLLDAVMDWDGDPNYNPLEFTNPDFNMSVSPTCIDPAQSLTLTVNFTPQHYLQTSTLVSLIFDACPDQADVVEVRGKRDQLISAISMDTSPIDFGNFTEASKSKTFTVSNSGNLGFTVSGLSFSSPSVSQHFRLEPPSFTLQPSGTAGDNQSVTLFFEPTTFGSVTTNITLENNAMQGDETISFTGNRYSNPVINIVSGSPLVFPNPNELKPLIVSNDGNDVLNISNITPPNENLQTWSVLNFNPISIASGQSATVANIRRSGEPAVDETLTIVSNKNQGVNTFVVHGETRIINVASTATIPSSTAASFSGQVRVYNAGNTELRVDQANFAGASPGMFTFSTALPFTIPPNNGFVDVTVTYQPPGLNFNLNSATLTFIGNESSSVANIVTLYAQRTAFREVSLSPPSIEFTGANETRYVTITNIGNDRVYFDPTPVTYSFPINPGNSSTSSEDWYASIDNAAVALDPGMTRSMSIFSTNNNLDRQFINVVYNKTTGVGNAYVDVFATTRVLSLPTSPVQIPSSSASSFAGQVRVYNTGNTTLTINQATFGGAAPTMFSFDSALPFTVPASGYLDVSVRYTPPAFNFSLNSATLILNGDQTNGTGNTVTVQALRTAYREVSVVPQAIEFTNANETRYATITNLGNDRIYLDPVPITYSFPINPGNSSQTSEYWYASVDNPTSPLDPGASRSMSIYLNSPAPARQYVNIQYNKTAGGGTAYIDVSATTRIISLPTSPVVIPSSSASSFAGQVRVYNNGNAALTVSQASFSGSAAGMFSFDSSLPFVVSANSYLDVSIRYTPPAYNFNVNSATMTLTGDQTNGTGNTVTVQAQRTVYNHISVSPTIQPSIKPWAQVQTTYVTNDGNVDVTINSISNSNSTKFNVQYKYYSGGILVNTTLPIVLVPGQTLNVEVRSADGYYTSATGTLTVSNTTGTNYAIQVSRAEN